MRLTLTILLSWVYVAKSTVYYVSNSGSDANPGTSQAATWVTIAKVNSSTFSPGDTIKFVSGGVWNERLVITNSGNSSNPIVYTSYNSGPKPLITGFQTVTGLTNSGNIWSATVSSAVANLNTVLVNGVLRAKGRYPNTGYLTQSTGSTTQVSNAGLTGTPNYTGAEIVARDRHWVLDKSIAASQSTSTINVSPAFSYTLQAGYGFFIQNISSALDQEGEWCKPSSTNLFSVYSASQPSVQVSTIDTLLWISKKNYITVDGLQFTGGNVTAVQIDTANNVTIKNCTTNYCGNGVSAQKCPSYKVLNCTLQNSLNNGTAIYNSGQGLIDGCIVKNSGTMPGMGESGEGKYIGIYNGGNDTSTVVSNNIIDSSGYQGIMFFSAYGFIYQNYVTNFTFVKDDGGGIYAGWYYTIVRKNIVGNAGTADAGTPDQYPNPCIYIDDFQNYTTVDSNTVFNSRWAGINMSKQDHYFIKDNLVYNDIGLGIMTDQPAIYASLQRNVVYVGSSSYLVYRRNAAASITDTIDYNYYLRPSNEANKLMVNGSTSTNLSVWRSATGYDTHSSETPTGTTGELPVLYYNPSQSDSTISLGSDLYLDAKGVAKSGSITLKPFTSNLLFKRVNTLIITGQTRKRLYKSFKSL